MLSPVENSPCSKFDKSIVFIYNFKKSVIILFLTGKSSLKGEYEMKKTASITLFIVAIIVSMAMAQEGSMPDTIQSAPIFVVGDKWVYDGGFDSLEDAKADKNSRWKEDQMATRIVREINDKTIVIDNPKGNRRFIYDKNLNLLESHRNDQSTFYKPSWTIYQYPLRVGGKYDVSFSHNRPDGFDNDFSATVKVVGWETVTVPAGTFKALKIEMYGYWTHSLGVMAGSGRADFKGIWWFVPEVKRHVLYLWEASWRTGSRSYYESLKSYSVSASNSASK